MIIFLISWLVFFLIVISNSLLGTRNTIQIITKNIYIETIIKDKTYSGIEIVVVSDPAFVIKLASQLATFDCYCKRYNYTLTILDPNLYKNCSRLPFFFAKHCTVAEYMTYKSNSNTIVVTDGDVVAGLADRDLSYWLDQDPEADLIFYERDTFPEITSGIYIARNTEHARRFLYTWARYAVYQPPGFSSADNGAIHLAIITEIGFKDTRNCWLLYLNLIHGQEHKDWWSDYFRYIACTRELLGPPRHWKTSGAKILILPARRAWVIDFYSLSNNTNDFYPWAHGVKNFEKIYTGIKPAKFPDRTQICLFDEIQATKTKHLKTDDLLRYIVNYEKNKLKPNSDTDLVPLWKLIGKCGMECKSLKSEERISSNRTQRITGTGTTTSQWIDNRYFL